MKVYKLIICHTCHKRVKKDEHYSIWENSVYCDPCMDNYVELIAFDSEDDFSEGEERI